MTLPLLLALFFAPKEPVDCTAFNDFSLFNETIDYLEFLFPNYTGYTIFWDSSASVKRYLPWGNWLQPLEIF